MNYAELDERLENYFDQYVPDSGTAETEGGEIVRAMMRILYRWYNDGDKVGVGYGRETVDPSNEYLLKTVPAGIYVDLYGHRSSKAYEKAIYDNIDRLLGYFQAKPEIFSIENHKDSRMSRV